MKKPPPISIPTPGIATMPLKKRKKPPVTDLIIATNQSNFSLCSLAAGAGPLSAMDIIGTIKFYLDEEMKIYKLEVVCRNKPAKGDL